MARTIDSLTAWRLMIVLCALLGAGCVGQPAARVLVAFDSEAGIASRANEFRVVVQDRDGEVAADYLYTLVAGAPDVGETALPYELTLEPRDDDVSSTYELVGTLYDRTGAVITTQRARGIYVADEALELRLVFDDACADVTCDYGVETCQQGACYEPCVIPTPIGALGTRRSPAVSCPETPACPDGDPPQCVPHGGGQGVHTCEDGVHVITHCDAGCVATSGAHCL